MPAGYSVSATAIPSLPVGGTGKVTIAVNGPAPITINKPYIPDDVIRVRFTVNPQIVRVTGARIVQKFDHVAPLDHTVFGWTWTGQAAERPPSATTRTYVVYVWFWEGPGDPNAIEKPFDVQMGPLFEVDLVGVAPGATQVDITTAVFGEWDNGTVVDDGSVTVVA